MILREEDHDGFVYWVGSDWYGDPIKIGYAHNVRERLYKLRTASWIELQVFGYVPGDQRVEKRIHAYLDPVHVRGEWFEREPALELLEDMKIEWMLHTEGATA